MPIALTPRSFLRALLIAGLLALFALGAALNFAPPAAMAADYARWGFPEPFHYVTSGMEATAAILLTRWTTRRAGAIIGGLVMLGALATLLLHGEYAHALAPLCVLIALGLCLYLDDKALEARWEGKVF